MPRDHDNDDFDFDRPTNPPNWKRWAWLGGLVGGALVAVLLVWNLFFVYVPPGQHLIIISKHGKELEPGQVLAGEGDKGIQEEVKGEGWHFVWPVIYEREIRENTVVPPGQVGIVTARGGQAPAEGQVLADKGQRGIRRDVFTPGAYRINRYGYDVALVPATEVKTGFVGVRRRLLGREAGREAKGRFAAENSDEVGFLRQILQPGLYFLNTKEYEVISVEVGIFQTSFNHDMKPGQQPPITFTAKGGLDISMDCTVEWEVGPEDMPYLVSEYGTKPRQKVEQNVIAVQAQAIGRDKGINYSAQDFLEGRTREKFQEDFTKQLTQVCAQKNVMVRSAFIRNIVIPESYLKEIRQKQIATEAEVTNQAREATAQSEAEVERELRIIDQRVLEVQADTARLVASLDREVTNLETKTKAEIEKMKADYEAKIAALDAQRTQLTGAAEAEVTRLKETATAGKYELRMKVFEKDADAYLRYSLAEQLNPQLKLRLFHSGPGTFWTNLEGKGMNFLLPASSGTKEQPTSVAPSK